MPVRTLQVQSLSYFSCSTSNLFSFDSGHLERKCVYGVSGAEDTKYTNCPDTHQNSLMFCTVFRQIYVPFVDMRGCIERPFCDKMMHCSEVLLYCNIAFSEILVNLFFMILSKSSGDSVYLEEKTIGMATKDLSTLSLLRYMLSVELVSEHLVNWRETLKKCTTEIRS